MVPGDSQEPLPPLRLEPRSKWWLQLGPDQAMWKGLLGRNHAPLAKSHRLPAQTTRARGWGTNTPTSLSSPPPMPAVAPHWLNPSASHKGKGLTEWSLAVSLPGHNIGDRDLGRSKAKMRAVQAFWVNKGANHPLQLITHHFLAHSPHTSHLRLFSTKLTKAISHPKPVHMLFLPPRILLLLTCSANYL